MRQLIQKILVPLLLALTVTQVYAHDYEIDGIYYNILQYGKSVEVTRGDFHDIEYSGEITIPPKVSIQQFSYNFTSIGDAAFYNCKDLTAVKLPNTISSIGASAFAGCTSLVSVNIPNSVTLIGDCAFGRCTDLTFIEIPSSISTISYQMFNNCTSLKKLVIPNTVTSFEDYAFCYCTSLESIEIPNSITSIGGYAFSNCTNLTSIEIPNTVSFIGQFAFCDCTSLKYIEIPRQLTSINLGTFMGCRSLTSIEIPKNITQIGRNTFRDCINLQEIYLYSKIPANCDETTFQNISTKDCILYVPDKAIKTYKSVYPWNLFENVDTIKTILAENALIFKVGDYVQIDAESLIESDIDKSITWSSDAPEVAAVDADGKVWFNGVGEATVTAECQGLTAAMSFRVEAVEAEDLNVFPAEAVGGVGQSFYMLALHTPDNTTDKSVSWESSDPTVATVDEDGRIELLAQGQTTVTATSGAHTATATITVSDSTVGLVELAGNGVAIKVADGGIDVLNAPEMARVIVSGVDGRVVTAMYAESAELHIPLTPGIYLVKVGDTLTAKVLVK